MTYFYLLYSPHSDTIGIVDIVVKNMTEFEKHVKTNHKFMTLVYHAPYKYLVEDKKAEILAKCDLQSKSLQLVIHEHLHNN